MKDLEREWSQQAAANFLKKTDHRLRQLTGQPFTGAPSEKRRTIYLLATSFIPIRQDQRSV
jgi:hypothetical protein